MLLSKNCMMMNLLQSKWDFLCSVSFFEKNEMKTILSIFFEEWAWISITKLIKNVLRFFSNRKKREQNWMKTKMKKINEKNKNEWKPCIRQSQENA